VTCHLPPTGSKIGAGSTGYHEAATDRRYVVNVIPVLMRVVSFALLLAALSGILPLNGAAPTGAQVDAPPTCYRLDSAITCANNPTKATARPTLGAIAARLCQMQVDATGGKLSLTCPRAALVTSPGLSRRRSGARRMRVSRWRQG